MSRRIDASGPHGEASPLPSPPRRLMLIASHLLLFLLFLTHAAGCARRVVVAPVFVPPADGIYVVEATQENTKDLRDNCVFLALEASEDELALRDRARSLGADYVAILLSETNGVAVESRAPNGMRFVAGIRIRSVKALYYRCAEPPIDASSQAPAPSIDPS